MPKRRTRSKAILGPGFGDFQSNVGKLSASVSLVVSWIIGIGLIIGAVVVAVFAFIPTTHSCNKDFEDCDDKPEGKSEGKPKKKKRNPLLLLVSLGMVLVACLMIWVSVWWKKKVKHNRAAAQIGGTLTEIQLAKNIFGR